MKNKIILILTIFITACGTAKLATPTPTDVERGAAMFPGYTITDLNAGKAHYEQYCGTCHGLKKVSAYNEEQWRKIVPDMVKKVNRKEGRTAVDATMEELILKYVITMKDANK